MKVARTALALAIILILFVFSIYNAQLVQLTLFGYQSPHLPLFLVLIFSFFLGFFLSALYYAFQVSRLRRQNGQLQKEKEALHVKMAQQRPPTMP